MARRSDHTREELLELAIQSGITLIEEEGFAQFSTRKVAAKMGYTVGTLYHLFGSYDDFVLHVNARTLDMWYEDMEKAITATGSEAVHQMAKEYIRFSKEHYNRWIVLFEHHYDHDQDLPEWYKPKFSRFFTLLEKLLTSLTNDPHHTARVLWAGIHGICILSLSQKLGLVAADDPEKLAATLVASCLEKAA